MRSGVIFLILSFLIVSVDQTYASEPASEDSPITFSGTIDFSTGAVVDGKYRATSGTPKEANQYPYTVKNQWFGNPLALLNLDVTPTERLKISFGFEGSIFLSTFDPEYLTEKSSNGGLPIIPQFMDWRVHQAQGIFSLRNRDPFAFEMAIGLMPYKYNNEVRNLGEFMFRSGTYPLYLETDFNFPMARLSGIRLGMNYRSDRLKVRFEQFILAERKNPPLNDISLASIASVNILKLFDIGAGVNFARIIPVNKKITNPKAAFYVENEDTVFDSNGNPVLDNYGNVVMDGDTGHYTFQGTKLMARLTIDPFGLVRGDEESFLNEFLGENGGKIYSEILISGLKNYPANAKPKQLNNNSAINQFGYAKLSERMPYMIGITIPMWKILDVCAIEIEKFPAPYPNDYYQAHYNSVLPIPTWLPEYHQQFQINTSLDTIPFDNPYDSTLYADNAKRKIFWSVYMRKQILEHFSIVGQIARDHMRWRCNLGNAANYDTEEIFAKNDQWAWRVGLLYNF